MDLKGFQRAIERCKNSYSRTDDKRQGIETCLRWNQIGSSHDEAEQIRTLVASPAGPGGKVTTLCQAQPRMLIMLYLNLHSIALLMLMLMLMLTQYRWVMEAA
jgi:hypothetical protein